MLRQSLKAVLPEPGDWIEEAGLVPTVRAEEVPVSGFVRLAQTLVTRL
jgi:16S rRNA (adenine1518-N6/adenine1519-N6)-dimethyltransferase